MSRDSVHKHGLNVVLDLSETPVFRPIREGAVKVAVVKVRDTGQRPKFDAVRGHLIGEATPGQDYHSVTAGDEMAADAEHWSNMAENRRAADQVSRHPNTPV